MEGLSGNPGPEMSFEVDRAPRGTVVVKLRGELDISNVGRLEAAVAPVLETGPEQLLVDVGELRFADTSAIAVWVRWATAVPSIELRNPSSLLRQVITRMGLSDTLRIAA